MIKIDIDAASIAREFKEMALEVEQDLRKGVGRLAASMHAKILEDSQQQLHTSRKKYADALNRLEEITPGVYVIALDESALWIEEGLSENYDMKPGLLKNARTSSNGKKYRVIPFEHSKPASEMTGLAQAISRQAGRELKKRGLPFKKLEYGPDARPIVSDSPLHKFDFVSAIPGRGNTPALKGLAIYQGMANGNVRRRITTFRTVSEDQIGKWIHPGVEAKHFFESASEWGFREWENVMLPEILEKWR
jgi:hypothetical protein